MIKAGYPQNLLMRLFDTYDPVMHRLDYKTTAIQRHKNRLRIGAVVSKENLYTELEDSYRKLDDRERTILKYRYDKLMTLKQCADKYNVSVERIRQLENRACCKIQEADSNRYFNIFWPQSKEENHE